ncbi:MAG: endolytic transglycosylase MltG [Ruminococcus sp.]|nr:endolytic transglycosylase MltG [Ruminococcus sp.]MCM1382379.1 endolytic transglycosylase MltG [Muribaculaceae bacterium]MCM1479311.1 endolytic transglycosylase MltG [Muribaculaceae bacterium]
MEQKEYTEDKVTLNDILESMPEEIGETAQNAENVPEEENTEIAEQQAALEKVPVETEEGERQAEENIPGGEAEEVPEEPDEEYDEYEEDIPKNRYKEKPRRKKRGHGHLIFGMLLSAVIISVSILAAVFILKWAKELFGIDKSERETVVDIPLNSSTVDIAEILYNEGIITDVNLFRAYSKFKGADGTYIAGSHVLSPKMTYNDIIETLQEEIESKRDTVDVVFPEGITLYEAAQRLEEKNVCNAAEFIEVFNSSKFGFDFEETVKINSLKFYKMEGYFFPDTYQFYVEEDPMIVAKKIYKNFDARITPDYYGRMRDLEMDLEEVLTLASIVQAEASNTRDMKNVASVFYNRLNNPDEYPLLQSDPTTNYVEDVIMPNIEYKSEKIFEAYDTYRGAGLPPGPICNPGLDAINAVLYPAETDYYYFCSNLETGEFYYAETLEEHEQNLVEAGLV